MNRIGDYVPGAGYCACIVSHRGMPAGVYSIDGVKVSAVVMDTVHLPAAAHLDHATEGVVTAGSDDLIRVAGSIFDTKILRAIEEEHGECMWHVTTPLEHPCGITERMIVGQRGGGVAGIVSAMIWED